MAFHSSDGPKAVRVSAPARLSFTLISLDGTSMRRNGIAAMAVDRPGLTAEVRRAEDGVVRVTGAAEETARELTAALGTLRELWGGPPARLDVVEALPQHSGFGSKTTTLLAVGHAYARLCGVRVELRELAQTLGRGRTSGASTGLAELGGFLVDGGHVNPPDFAAAPQTYLRPSRFAQQVAPPRPVVRLDFPDWPILVLLTHGRHLGGQEELAWFHSVTPIPPQESWRTSHLVFMGLAPAVLEEDFDAFCAAVNAITFTGHFKQAQIAFQGESVTGVLDAGRAEPSVDAIALSVTGPACFAFTRRPAEAALWAEELRVRGLIRDFWFTKANNQGISSTVVS
ncbi:beta-ribofuranosylaminobenzene 5'-phosphate synthase [Kitasatospora sp. MAP12-15]|uniref:beta-ribofuranosylaminobenzene 5'-phosphate synthase family protein n=1 Tax=unclassified Kitasatospora TaxID=2633591 RepID=UPI0024759D99|nr:beta-ribofuranosylaminobenzene 5'-phosphate synthase family protein [Kitasatospora sp. MAP12-44]MDH6111747.1 beta-ribofuranosylaminobenzene 5'-phosphate synthase [Kitasatospora sp. MAP12-44]